MWCLLVKYCPFNCASQIYILNALENFGRLNNMNRRGPISVARPAQTEHGFKLVNLDRATRLGKLKAPSNNVYV